MTLVMRYTDKEGHEVSSKLHLIRRQKQSPDPNLRNNLDRNVCPSTPSCNAQLHPDYSVVRG